jgi:hypothetical protein
MPEKRLEKTRDSYPELNCTNHVWLIQNDTDIAAIIEPNGLRTTIKYCFNYGLTIRYTRSQEDFEKELLNFIYQPKSEQ